MKQKILIAVDAGGTKTEYCAKSLPDGKMRNYTYGGSNYKTIGLKQTKNNLIEGFQAVCKAEQIKPEDVKLAVFGIAGCDTKEDLDIYSDMIKSIGLNENIIHIYNDCELAFLAIADPPGLCIVAGTGSNCMAFQKNKPMIRAGGWSALLSDGGSGYWIARQVMEEMLLCYDGIGPDRPVYERIAQHFDIREKDEIPNRFTVMNVPDIASAARTILESAEDGDEYALSVIKSAHEELLKFMTLLVQRMRYSEDEELSIVLNGSLFSNDLFTNQFSEELTKRVPNKLSIKIADKHTSDNAMILAQKIHKAQA